MKKLGVRVLIAREENREHTDRVGELLSALVTGPEVVAAVERMLAEDPA